MGKLLNWRKLKIMIRRIFVEKKPSFAVEAEALLADLQINLGVKNLTRLRVVNRYDLEGISAETYESVKNLIMSEPPVDMVYDEELPIDQDVKYFAVEFLPGQYNQRADSAAECIQIITQDNKPLVNSAKVYLLYGAISTEDLLKIKNYCVNPVETREAMWQKPNTLAMICEEPEPVKFIDNFTAFSRTEIENFRREQGLAMSLDDIIFCQGYFIKEKRNPSITEIKVLDTYWSDHCRHTTFNTVINDVEIVPHRYTKPIQMAYDQYLADREDIYTQERAISLMDIAVLGMKKLRKEGLLNDLDSSEEINACSIVVPVKADGVAEEWLVMFKNETHNHPTEIEPFGGAATCLGGAIRDPLSGRSYVYQAMRVTGAADPRTPIEETLPGKLSQRKITLGAAAGYSSYGNQIGLATGHVEEFYHDNFVAKRMEVGAVIGAAPRAYVRRETPVAGDKVILLGGATGRDGCGGATGSSKEHDLDSITTCGAEVQKGNAPTERKIQRLFRNQAVTRLIKRCNDFGAGGVSVAIGELTEGLEINLDAVPKKYEGLDGTELAISESQERMAVVVATEDVEKFIELARVENLLAVVVAEVTNKKRLVMNWRGQKIVDIAREFLDTNGVAQSTNILVKPPSDRNWFNQIDLRIDEQDLKKTWLDNLSRLNVASQKGLVERFDSTVGGGTVLMPFGGKTEQTASEGMVAKIPALSGEVDTATIMTCGYNPDLAMWSPFHGAVYAVVQSVARAVALGANPDKIRLSLQEYFEKLNSDEAWGKPFAALLGAYVAQIAFAAPAIGGKDSMSGTFMDKKVPPTLISFAVGLTAPDKAVSSEFKRTGSQVVFVSCPRDEAELPIFEDYVESLKNIYAGIQSKKIIASSTVREGGIASTISQMCFGNNLGFEFAKTIDNLETLFINQPGGLILELAAEVNLHNDFFDLDYLILGRTTNHDNIIVNGVTIKLEDALNAWSKPLAKIFPATKVSNELTMIDTLHERVTPLTYNGNIAEPKVFIPVFPGTNCEYDAARAFELAGAKTDVFVVKNLAPTDIAESCQEIAQRIRRSQMIMLPGGFSAGDEPDGSGKFIATMFRNPWIKEAITELLEERDGLMLGICNGFQVLVKLGLLPYGKIVDMTATAPTLTYNNINRHVSNFVSTRITSNLSPWLSMVEVGAVHAIPVSHGEGKFYATDEDIKKMFANGQIATQYVDKDNKPTMVSPFNPNGSLYAIEGITSPDGRIFGKMGHSERNTPHTSINIPGNKDQQIFLAGVKYFK